MDWLVIGGSGRRELVSWTPEAKWLFQQIIDDAAGVPSLRGSTGNKRVRPVIFVNRRIAVAGCQDGIAVKLDPERTQQALQIPGCLLLGQGDQPRVLRGMVSLPWSARDHWRGLARAAIQAVPPR
jgi:hypothetical protein